jgi:hypothetical protein
MSGRETWRDRELRFTLVVSQPEGGYYRAQAAWADNGEVISACDAPRPADCLAGAAGALANVFGRVDLASGVEQAIKRPGVNPLGAREPATPPE